MSEQDLSLESDSDRGERRDYPGTIDEYSHRIHRLPRHSEMVPLDFFQYLNSRSLQLQCSWNMGSHELAWSRRSAIAASRQRRQCPHILPDGR